MPLTDPLKTHAVTVGGRADATRTLVFVHGFGTDQSAWHAVAEAFQNDFRTVLMDNAGAGRADPAAFVQHRYLNLHAYADDVVAVCQALRLRDAILVGHSSGAMVGALAALKAPALFSRLVLLGASPRYQDDEGYKGGFSKDDLDGIYSGVMNRFPQWVASFAPQATDNPDQPQLAQDFARALLAIPPERVFTVLCSILQSDHRAELAQLDKPTLIIQTQRDVFVPMEVAHFLHRQISGSQLTLIDATGHFPHLSAPALVVGAMREFVTA